MSMLYDDSVKITSSCPVIVFLSESATTVLSVG